MKTFIICVLLTATLNANASDAPSLTAEQPIVLAGKAGSFDFMAIDNSTHRVLAAHHRADTLEILDLTTGKPLLSIEVGEVQGVAVDIKGHQYFLGNDGNHSIAIVDSKNLLKTGEVKVDGPVDAIAFNPKNQMLYAAQDDGDKVWVIDIKNKKIVATVKIPGVPEVIEYDSASDKLYLNIKDKDVVVRIDPITNKVDRTWSTLPAASPHGIAIDNKRSRIFVAGGKGQLVAIDLNSGKVLSSVTTADRVDQIAYDSGNKIIYCAGKGFISMVKADGKNLIFLSNTPSPNGAHTLAVDPTTHDVWVSYSDKIHSYLQKFKTVVNLK